MLQATPRMIDKVYGATGLLVHHLDVVDSDFSVLRIDRIHVVVCIPRVHWGIYGECVGQNQITPELADIDKDYTAKAIEQITAHKYQVTSTLVSNVVSLAADMHKNQDMYTYEWSFNGEINTFTVNYYSGQTTLEVAKVFKGAQYDREYIERMFR